MDKKNNTKNQINKAYAKIKKIAFFYKTFPNFSLDM